MVNVFTSQHVSINSSIDYNLIFGLLLFTSQHVSINSHLFTLSFSYHLNLHPNMYLLIPGCISKSSHSFSNLHPNMYLLILIKLSIAGFLLSFTSQHVSINSGEHYVFDAVYNEFTSQHVSINSISYLV